MSDRFQLERRFTILYARQHGSAINHNYEIVCRCARVPRNIVDGLSGEVLPRGRRRRLLRKDVTSRYDKSPTCHAQIQFYEARSRRVRVHRPRRGTPRGIRAALEHDVGSIPLGAQAFGDLAARQPRLPLDSEKGMYTGEGRSLARYPLEDGERGEPATATGFDPLPFDSSNSGPRWKILAVSVTASRRRSCR